MLNRFDLHSLRLLLCAAAASAGLVEHTATVRADDPSAIPRRFVNKAATEGTPKAARLQPLRPAVPGPIVAPAPAVRPAIAAPKPDPLVRQPAPKNVVQPPLVPPTHAIAQPKLPVTPPQFQLPKNDLVQPRLPVRPDLVKPVLPKPSGPTVVNPGAIRPLDPKPTFPVRPDLVKPVFPKPSGPAVVNPGAIRPLDPKPTFPVRPDVIKPLLPKPNGPAVVNPGTIKPLDPKPTFPIRPDLIKPALPKPKDPIVLRPDLIKPIVVRPDLQKPGVVNPDLVKPAIPKPKPIVPGLLKPGLIAKPDLKLPGDVFKPGLSLGDKLVGGKLGFVGKSPLGEKLQLAKQFDLMKKGDLAVQLGLFRHGHGHGHGHDHAFTFCGPIHGGFHDCHFGWWYPGCHWCPSACWMPHWCGWVDWCWWDWCYPVCDPRPIWCRPIWCTPCPTWVWCEVPVWQPLPVVTCGTWVDVAPIVVADSGLDLQLLAVRFVDAGHPEVGQGSRHRIWLRNNSDRDILRPFNVMVFADTDRTLTADLPQAGTRVETIAAGATVAVDVRLPFASSTMGRDAQGNPQPYSFLHVLVDSHQEVPEAFEANNGLVLAREDEFPVDPAVFATDTQAPVSGSVLTIAGEGFGPQPGQVVLFVGGMEFQAEIRGWYDLGAQVQLPNLPLTKVAEAELVVVRGDGAAAPPLTVQLAPATPTVSTAP